MGWPWRLSLFCLGFRGRVVVKQPPLLWSALPVCPGRARLGDWHMNKFSFAEKEREGGMVSPGHWRTQRPINNTTNLFSRS